MDNPTTGNWQTRTVRPHWSRTAIRPADVRAGLEAALLDREAMLEDATYRKVAPNQFVVEVNPRSYETIYAPIAARVVEQWGAAMLEHLMTVNSRLGRKEYSLGGRMWIEIRPAEDLDENTVRIRYRISPEAGGQTMAYLPLTGCLELLPTGTRFRMQGDLTVLGRDPAAGIRLDSPIVVERRLVSAQHAYIRSAGGDFYLYDGSPEGKPSLNGTYLNGRRVVPGQGQRLEAGDLIQLAALDPNHPQPDTPGVVTLRFLRECA
jgi:hypothetical protein